VDKLNDSEKATQAEARAAYWLAEANRRQEAGKPWEREMRKSQHWLDKATKLRGWA
jgi:hypothetical protein